VLRSGRVIRDLTVDELTAPMNFTGATGSPANAAALK
jgi:hypothetical protein